MFVGMEDLFKASFHSFDSRELERKAREGLR
jgi:hypothetical protein